MTSPNMPSTPLATLDAMRAKMKRLAKLKGRQTDTDSLAAVRALIGERPVTGYPRDMLIEYLHKLQDAYRGLHEGHLVALAKEMNIPMAEVYEVATFYHHFEVLREGDTAAGITVRVCDSLSCEMAGAKDLMARLPAILGSEDVKVIAAPCLGRCEQAPVVAVHQNPIANATTDKVVAAVKAGKTTHAQSDQRLDYIDYAAYQAAGGYQLLKGLDSEATIKIMEDSGLRGLGGAGFPSGRKWRIVKGQAGEKLMAVNIDEGEPGTFKDRTYLERDISQFGPRISAQVLRRLWGMLAHQQGGVVNVAQLARNLEVDAKTANSYINLLTDLLLLRKLSAWHGNIGKQLVKSPKIYLRDSGLVHALLSITNKEQLLSHPTVGASWEGYCMENILSKVPQNVQASFYRNSQGAEIDLLLTWPSGEVWAIEIKRSLAPKLERGFYSACEDIKPTRKYVVYAGSESYPLGQGIQVVSLEDLMQQVVIG